MIDVLGIPFGESQAESPSRYIVRHKRRVDFIVNGVRVAALVKSGVLAKVTRQADGRDWYSYAGAEALTGGPVSLMAQGDLRDSLTVGRQWADGGQLAYQYKGASA